MWNQSNFFFFQEFWTVLISGNSFYCSGKISIFPFVWWCYKLYEIWKAECDKRKTFLLKYNNTDNRLQTLVSSSILPLHPSVYTRHLKIISLLLTLFFLMHSFWLYYISGLAQSLSFYLSLHVYFLLFSCHGIYSQSYLYFPFIVFIKSL